MTDRRQWKGAPPRDSSERPGKGGPGCDGQAVATVTPPGIEVVSVSCIEAVPDSMMQNRKSPTRSGPSRVLEIRSQRQADATNPASGRRPGWPRRSERPYGRSRRGRPRDGATSLLPPPPGEGTRRQRRGPGILRGTTSRLRRLPQLRWAIWNSADAFDHFAIAIDHFARDFVCPVKASGFYFEPRLQLASRCSYAKRQGVGELIPARDGRQRALDRRRPRGVV
jgi:hypothetical protein